MFSKAIRYLLIILSMAIAVSVILSKDSFSTLIPEQFNPLKSLNFNFSNKNADVETEAERETKMETETETETETEEKTETVEPQIDTLPQTTIE